MVCLLSFTVQFDITNNNNPSKTFRHSRNLSEDTNNSHTTSASDDASNSPDPAACDRPDQRTTEDRDADDSDRDVPCGLDSAFQPADCDRSTAAAGQRSPSVIVGATNASKPVTEPQLQAAATIKKRRLSRTRTQVYGGAAPAHGDCHGSTSTISNGFSSSNAHLAANVPSEKFVLRGFELKVILYVTHATIIARVILLTNT